MDALRIETLEAQTDQDFGGESVVKKGICWA